MIPATLRLTMCKRCRCMHIATDQFALTCVLRPKVWRSWRPQLCWDGGAVYVPPQMAKIVLRLALAKGAAVTVDELIDWLYGDDVDGGPDDAVGVTRVHLHKLQRTLSEAGFPGAVTNQHGRGHSLIMLPRPAEQREIAA